MKKLMKKKVSLFGKEVSVFAIVMVAMIGLVSAVLLPYFGVITGLVTVNQGLTWDGANWDDNLVFDFNNEVTTSLDAETFTSNHYLENTANVSAEFDLVTTCAATDDGCEDIEWGYEYLLDNSAGTCSGYPNEGWQQECEKRVGLKGMPLSALTSISWDANVISGYMPHVDVILSNGKALSFAYATIGAGCNDDISTYPTGEFNTFDGVILNDDAYAWESMPGSCGDSAFDAQHRTLAQWKLDYPGVNIVRIDLEIDDWIIESNSSFDHSNSVVKNILVNGQPVEVSGLIAGSKLYFDFKVDFPKMLKPDVYTIETKVMPIA